MAKSFSIQKDKRSTPIYAYGLSDTEYSAKLAPEVVTSLPAQISNGLAMITVSGSQAWVSINDTPIIPAAASFSLQSGHQINNGSVKVLSVNAGDVISIVSILECYVQVSIYANEVID